MSLQGNEKAKNNNAGFFNFENKFLKASNKEILSPSSEIGKQTSTAVANCIRGLNATIQELTNENAILRKKIEDMPENKKNNEKNEESGNTDEKTKKLYEINNKLNLQIKDLKEKNTDFQEKYIRVKEMYDILADQQQKTEKNIKKIGYNQDMLELKKKYKKTKEINSKYVLEIENLKSQLRISKQTIEELEEKKQVYMEQSKKSEHFVTDMAEVNDQLLNYIKSSSFKRSNHSNKKTPEESLQVPLLTKLEKDIERLHYKYEKTGQKESEKLTPLVPNHKNLSINIQNTKGVLISSPRFQKTSHSEFFPSST